MGKSAWKTTSVQDCGCLNQQKNAFSTFPLKPGESIKIRIKPCSQHSMPSAPIPFGEIPDSGNYFDNFVDGRGF